jgi:hypothetical protein
MLHATPKIHAGQIFGTWADLTNHEPFAVGTIQRFATGITTGANYGWAASFDYWDGRAVIFWLTLIRAVLSVGWFRLTGASE